jgi:Flp pilus assembly protein TadG
MDMHANRVNALAAVARAIRKRVRALRASTQGSAGVEFGFIAPGLILLFVTGADLGLGIYRKMQVQNAAQAGAAYAAARGFSAASITSAIQTATSYPVEATPAPSQFCGCPTGSGVSAAVCGQPCADGVNPGTYVSVGARGTYSTLLPYPGLPASFELTSRASVRIQ